MIADLPLPDTASPHMITATRALFAMSCPQREALQVHAKPLVDLCTQLVRGMATAPPEDFGENVEVEWLMHNVEREGWLQAFGPATRLVSLLGRAYLLPDAGDQDAALADKAREYEAKMLVAIYSEATGQGLRDPYYNTVPHRSATLEALLAPHMMRLFGNVPELVTELSNLSQLTEMPLAGMAHWVRLKLEVQSENDVALVRGCDSYTGNFIPLLMCELEMWTSVSKLNKKSPPPAYSCCLGFACLVQDTAGQ